MGRGLFGFEVVFAFGNAHPHGLLRAGERHIQQTDVFLKTFFRGSERLVFVFPEVGHKGQKHQGVLQTFGLVKGDDLDQLGIGFKSHLRRLALGLRIGQLIGQKSKQACLALQTEAGRLQQLAQMQEIG